RPARAVGADRAWSRRRVAPRRRPSRPHLQPRSRRPPGHRSGAARPRARARARADGCGRRLTGSEGAARDRARDPVLVDDADEFAVGHDRDEALVEREYAAVVTPGERALVENG